MESKNEGSAMESKSEGSTMETKNAFRLSTYQVVYLILFSVVGPAILNGAINFGLATAMYRPAPNPTTVWTIPGSLAGDAAVTVMIQVTLTWIIAGLLSRKDVETKKVKPIAWTPPAQPYWVNFFFFQGDFDWVRGGTPSRLLRLFLSALRGVIYAAVCLVLLWPFTLAYLIPVYGNDGIIDNWPTPQIFKAVLGAVLGVLTTPPVAVLSLIESYRESKALQIVPAPAESISGEGRGFTAEQQCWDSSAIDMPSS